MKTGNDILDEIQSILSVIDTDSESGMKNVRAFPYSTGGEGMEMMCDFLYKLNGRNPDVFSHIRPKVYEFLMLYRNQGHILCLNLWTLYE